MSYISFESDHTAHFPGCGCRRYYDASRSRELGQDAVPKDSEPVDFITTNTETCYGRTVSYGFGIRVF